MRSLYGSVSQKALCFLITADGRPVGDCWLQEMNLPEVSAQYPPGTDLRRIDLTLGEKDCWGRGVGTLAAGMLVDYAFSGEHADALHCLCYDYNMRSRKLWERLGFSLVRREPVTDNPKAAWELHYRLTRAEYQARRGASGAAAAAVAETRLPPSLDALQPSSM